MNDAKGPKVVDVDFRTVARERAEADEHELDGLRIDPKELDAAFRKARRVVAPLIEVAYLGTALVAAVRSAAKRAQRGGR